jgi:phosphatidylserine/phosphatidylglycerophosphate/cardiolipin synthase-like enzyme
MAAAAPGRGPSGPAGGGPVRRGPILGIAAIAVIALLAAAGVALWRALPGGGPGPGPVGAIPRGTLPEGGWEVCFTPGGDCTGLIVAALGHARQRVLVQAYAFTSAPIARALVEAHRRGVEVRVILDRSQLGERYGSGTFLSHAGIPVLVDDPPGIAHSKVMVIDGEEVITGSFNFTRAAQERNAENLLLLRDPRLATAYAANWERRRAVSVPYDDASAPSAAAERAPDSGKHARHNLF